MYISIVSYGCCKSRSESCTCCNGCTCILQAPVLNVLSVFPTLLQVCLSGCRICFHIYSASVLSRYCVCLQRFQVFFWCFCKCFRRIFQMFHLFSDVCCIWMFQTRSSVASPSSPFCCLASMSSAGGGSRCQVRVEVVSTGVGGPHVLEGGGPTWARRRGTGGSGAGVWTSGR